MGRRDFLIDCENHSLANVKCMLRCSERLVTSPETSDEIGEQLPPAASPGEQIDLILPGNAEMRATAACNVSS
jgi:hypothetical protein